MKQRHVWTDDERKAVARMYEDGCTAAWMAAIVGKNQYAVRDQIRRMLDAGEIGYIKPRLPPGVDDAIIRFRRDGMRICDIAAKIGCAQATVDRRLRAMRGRRHECGF